MTLHEAHPLDEEKSTMWQMVKSQQQQPTILDFGLMLVEKIEALVTLRNMLKD